MNSGIPGVLVDRKSTYVASIKQFDRALLCARAFEDSHFRIHRCPHTTDNTAVVSDCLKELAVESGVCSRFNTDESLSKEGFRAMFTMWLSNSLNRSLADEVFVIHDRLAGGEEEELGFITVKKTSANIVNIGLLAVSASHRRKGLAYALLSRAVLWALEEVGGDPAAMLTVVTQGSNRPACQCYEKFGFSLSSVQDIYHCWLPAHLPPSAAVMTPPSRQLLHTTTTTTSSSSVLIPSDDHHTPFRLIHIPFCKQHFTGNEAKYVHELLTPRGPGSGLDSSSSRFTDCCSSRVHQLLGSRPKQQVLMVPSGTAALELAALLSDLREGDEVILPSYTFSSTANAFVLRGAVPVFVDIRADTLNIDESLIEGAITSRTKAVCVVHYRGVSCEMDAICSIVDKYGLILIEDAAQGIV
jgi:GNAT superfamily N-acetyltransferase